jgi:L-iditol 2-dehydrogenase
VIKNIYNGSLKTAGVVSSIFSIENWQDAFDKATGREGDLKVAFKL